MIGTRQRFHYPNFGTPVGYPEHKAHSGQIVTVVEALNTIEECAELMYVVRCDDGTELNVWAHELGDVPSFRPHDPAYCGCERG